MRHSLRLTRITLAAVSVAACCLLNCDSKPPRPVISGPDSGWTRAPLLFRAFGPNGGPLEYAQDWSWGDGQGGSFGDHTYAAPGAYVVTCTAVHWWPDIYLRPPSFSKPSLPCTTRIVQDTLVFPDSIVATISVGFGEQNQACMLPNGDWLYVSCAASGSVYAIDTRTNTVTDTIAVTDSPSVCIASSSGQYVYVSKATGNSLAVIRTSDNMVVDSVQVGHHSGALTILPNDSLLYVAHLDDNVVSVVRLDNASIVAQISVPGSPLDLAVKPGGDYVYAACGAGGVSAIRTSDNVVTASVPLAGEPAGMTFSPSGDTVYVACPSTDSIVLLRTEDFTRVGAVNQCSLGVDLPRYVSLLPGGACLYLRCDGIHGTAILRRSDNYLLRTFMIGGYADVGGVVAHPSGDRVYLPVARAVIVLGLRPGH